MRFAACSAPTLRVATKISSSTLPKLTRLDAVDCVPLLPPPDSVLTVPGMGWDRWDLRFTYSSSTTVVRGGAALLLPDSST